MVSSLGVFQRAHARYSISQLFHVTSRLIETDSHEDTSDAKNTNVLSTTALIFPARRPLRPAATSRPVRLRMPRRSSTGGRKTRRERALHRSVTRIGGAR